MNPDEVTLMGPQGSMSRATFARFRSLIYQLSGIALGEGKEGLVRARVSKRLRALAIDDYDDYFDHLMADASGDEIIHLLDVISTNVTSFFREDGHFRILSEAARRWEGEGRRRLRFWSAACSTGEEPYSMAMTLLDTFEGRAMDLRILATDLSTRALDRARQGTYVREKLGGVPDEFRRRYFDPDRRNPDALRVGAALRKSVAFARLNLADVPFPMSGPFDAVFCRNVMIYFDGDVRRRLVSEIRRLLRPGGYLIVGHSESLTGMIGDFRSAGPSVYVKP